MNEREGTIADTVWSYAQELAEKLDRCERFISRLRDPDDLGHAVSQEVRDGARRLIGSNDAGQPRCAATSAGVGLLGGDET